MRGWHDGPVLGKFKDGAAEGWVYLTSRGEGAGTVRSGGKSGRPQLYHVVLKATGPARHAVHAAGRAAVPRHDRSRTAER